MKMRTAQWIVGLAAALPLAAAHAEVDKRTERTWKAKCASCHGVDGKGATDQGGKMGISDYTSADWQKGITDAQMKTAINDGLKREKGGKQQEMDGYKEKLDGPAVDALVALIRGLKK